MGSNVATSSTRRRLGVARVGDDAQREIAVGHDADGAAVARDDRAADMMITQAARDRGRGLAERRDDDGAAKGRERRGRREAARGSGGLRAQDVGHRLHEEGASAASAPTCSTAWPFGRTTSTGQPARCITFCATEPMSQRFKPRGSDVPTTTRSASTRAASARIAFAGSPSA